MLSLLVASNALFSQSELHQVIAKNGLIVREAPERTANQIGKLSFQSIVSITEKTDQGAEIEDEGVLKKGIWVKVALKLSGDGSLEGYVFDAYLKPYDAFIYAYPDTASLKRAVLDGNYTESLAYLYLKANYEQSSRKEPLEYAEWDSGSVCAFQQKFNPDIQYYYWECKEAKGSTESLVLPKMELPKARQFVETLFYNKDNSWTSDFNYEADGVGCYYEIVQTATDTRIEIFCGC